MKGQDLARYIKDFKIATTIVKLYIQCNSKMPESTISWRNSDLIGSQTGGKACSQTGGLDIYIINIPF